MMIIYKYQLNVMELNTFEFGKNDKILKVAFQDSKLFMWVIHKDENKLSESRCFVTYMTGEPIKLSGKEYIEPIETVFQGPFVFHVFELKYL